MSQASEDDFEVQVTRHARERYSARVQRGEAAAKVLRRVGAWVREAIWCGRMVKCADGRFMVPLPMRGAYAVLAVEGPEEKPFSVAVLTILTEDMVARSHGHMIGLLALAA